jgi:hypothetical protein
MTYQQAVSVAATARAMGYDNVTVFRQLWCWFVEVRFSRGLGGFTVESENRTWRRNRLLYRGRRRVANDTLHGSSDAKRKEIP